MIFVGPSSPVAHHRRPDRSRADHGVTGRVPRRSRRRRAPARAESALCRNDDPAVSARARARSRDLENDSERRLIAVTPAPPGASVQRYPSEYRWTPERFGGCSVREITVSAVDGHRAPSVEYAAMPKPMRPDDVRLWAALAPRQRRILRTLMQLLAAPESTSRPPSTALRAQSSTRRRHAGRLR